MPAKLHKVDQSSAGRAAMMACEVFNLPVEMDDGDVVIKDPENDESEFFKRSSQLAIPVLEDGECTVMDGHEILPYIADKYGNDSPLYPKDEEKRSLVDERMMFSTGITFLKLCSATYPVFEEGKSGPAEEDLKEIEEAYTYLEEYLSNSKYLAGDEITIADIAVIADITSLVHVLPVDATKYPKIQAWIEDMEKQPFCQKYNAPGAELFGKIYKEKLGA